MFGEKVERNLELKSFISLFHKIFSKVKEKRRKEIMWRKRKGKKLHEQRLHEQKLHEQRLHEQKLHEQRCAKYIVDLYIKVS